MPTILIIDDDPIVLKFLDKILISAGYTVISANHGEAGLKQLKHPSISLVICDIHMPDINGLEILDSATQQYPLIPFIMLTAVDDTGLVVDAMKRGAFDYLSKPFERHTLLISVEKGIKQREILSHTLTLKQEIEQYRKRLETMVLEKTAELQRKSESLNKLNQSLKQTHMETVQSLTKILTIQDPYRVSHSEQTKKYCVAIGQKLRLSESELEQLIYAAYLHDIGEIFIPAYVLNKQSRLTSEEYKLIREHPLKSVEILESISYFKPILPVVRSHHEWFNGTGYPDGLKEKAIPLLARILNLADAYVAMTSERSYREAMSKKKACTLLQKDAGKQFDPALVSLCIDVINSTDR